MTERVEISVEYVHETNLAYLIKDGGLEVWLPKAHSTILTPTAPRPGEAVEMEVDEWLAMKEGLI